MYERLDGKSRSDRGTPNTRYLINIIRIRNLNDHISIWLENRCEVYSIQFKLETICGTMLIIMFRCYDFRGFRRQSPGEGAR